MATNYRSIAKDIDAIIRRSDRKAKSKIKNKGTGKLYSNIDPRDSKELLDAAAADMRAQVARRFLELLSANTPKKFGFLNGGWTAGTSEVRDRINLSPFPAAGEVATIQSKSANHVELAIRDAVDYGSILNYGRGGAEPRMYVEMAIRQLQRECAQLGINLKVTGGA